MADVDSNKKVYLFLHGRMDLNEKVMSALASNGFQKDNIVMASPKQAGEVGEYMAMLWICLLYTSPSPRDQRGSRMPSSA